MLRTALPLLLLAAACATVRAPESPVATTPAPPALPPEIVYEPEVIAPAQVDLELSDKNDEELFAIGSAAYGAGDFRRAAAAFARIADVHAQSSHAATAIFNAGMSYQKLEEWRLALERFRTFVKAYEGPDAVDAEFRVAQCLYHLDELNDARALLKKLADREGVEPELRIRALAERGVVELEAGLGEDAERTLQLALQTWREAEEKERLDEWHAAQAQFYLGEVYREWFRAIPLVPKGNDEGELAKALESKAQMLLTAQGHYIRAIRMQNEQWAVAAGFRCGELYDELRKQLHGGAAASRLRRGAGRGLPRPALPARQDPRREGDRRLRADARARRPRQGGRQPLPGADPQVAGGDARGAGGEADRGALAQVVLSWGRP